MLKSNNFDSVGKVTFLNILKFDMDSQIGYITKKLKFLIIFSKKS